MSELTEFLKSRINQLEDRRTMIPRYVKRPGKFLGKKDFSENDLPKIEMQIDETKAALRGIEDYKRNMKTVSKKQK